MDQQVLPCVHTYLATEQDTESRAVGVLCRQTFAEIERGRVWQEKSLTTIWAEVYGFPQPSFLFEPMDMPPSQRSISPTVVVVQRAMTERFQAEWHGNCRVCQANMPRNTYCPCGLHSHDHCTSYLLQAKPARQSSPCNNHIRVCCRCMHDLYPKVIITIKIQEANV